VVKDKSRSKRSDICEMVIMNDWLFGWKELVIQMGVSLITRIVVSFNWNGI
jgi:hypothetical protein